MTEIRFRKIQESDIKKIISWIRRPHVKEFWYSANDKSDSELYEKYIERIEIDRIFTFLIYLSGEPIGLIQTYYLDDTKCFMIDQISKGVDLFIGNEEYIGLGYGQILLKQFLRDYVFNTEDVLYACIDPEVRNHRAIHVYEKIGFRKVQKAVDSESGLLTQYMILHRNDIIKKRP